MAALTAASSLAGAAVHTLVAGVTRSTLWLCVLVDPVQVKVCVCCSGCVWKLVCPFQKHLQTKDVCRQSSGVMAVPIYMTQHMNARRP